MTKKLGSCYNFKPTASKIAKMSELVFALFQSLNESMSAYVDLHSILIKQLNSMGTALDETNAFGISVASIDITNLIPVRLQKRGPLRMM